MDRFEALVRGVIRMGTIRSHDALFRFVFGDPAQLAELLRPNLPPALAAAIDWTGLQRLDGTFVDASLSGRQADLLFEARLGEGKVLLYVLVEHKGHDDRFAALQVLRYVVRIWDRWQTENPLERDLPAVLPFVVHHGAAPWSSPRSVRGLVGLAGVPVPVAPFLLALQPDCAFVLDDLAAETEDGLTARSLSAVADLTLRFLQFLRHRSAAEAALDIARWQHLVTRVLDHPRGQEVLVAVFSWFLAGVPRGESALHTVMRRLDDPKTRQTMKSIADQLFEDGLVEGLQRGRREGRQEGRQEGRREVRCEVLLGLLRDRFGAVPAAYRSRLLAADEAELAAWTPRVLTAASIDAVFGGS